MLDSLHNFVSQSNWIGPFLVRVSICALMILIARRLLAYRWGAQIRRLLWTILIIRCLVPWTQPIHYHPAGLLEFNRNQEASITSSISSEQIDTYAYIEPDQTVQPLIVSQGNGPVLNGFIMATASLLLSFKRLFYLIHKPIRTHILAAGNRKLLKQFFLLFI